MFITFYISSIDITNMPMKEMVAHKDVALCELLFLNDLCN